jgi:hypothetical protein
MNRSERLERGRTRPQLLGRQSPRSAGWSLSLRWHSLLSFFIAVACVIVFVGGGSVPAGMQIWRNLDSVSHEWAWNFVGWEVDNIGQKLRWQLARPLAALTPDERSRLVSNYMDRAQEIGQLEWQLDQIYATLAPAYPAGAGSAQPDEVMDAQRRQLEARVTILREQQKLVRRSAEQAIQDQVSAVLAEHKIGAGAAGFPPVWFTFTEPPRKLVTSPRNRIATGYYAMLRADLPADERERIETYIFENYNLSAYVTTIGGLGALPSIVSDRAPLPWVLSTVAHEWVHNYLTLFPLGFNYGATPDLTILNETIADIAGDELGAEVLATAYPELARDFPGKDEAAASTRASEFDFDREMRHTREVVDQFLAAGRVEDAEEYMQIRRLLFLENGYALRKLNQAYFAFHGSYGTGAAATSSIGPKLQQLRSLTPDLRTFLETVRGFMSEADLDEALERWSMQ